MGLPGVEGAVVVAADSRAPVPSFRATLGAWPLVDPGARGNPPPPLAVDCPEAVAPSLYPFKLTRRAGSQECTGQVTEYHNVQCPPNVHCNPPPPSTTSITLPCPK
jgi:hypothetical protein